MSTTPSTPPTPAEAPKNKVNLTKADYAGSKSTLCTGCGHDSISSNISSAFFQYNIDPYNIAKMSGIGCSSKTPAYFVSKSHALNAVHGRMPSTSTGAKLANRQMTLIGVSGDGDTASIGLSGFIHMIRRNLPICYIVMNNGVYGLTKGQFSATSEKGAKLKTGDVNAFETIDLCTLALEMGCTFVARSFSGDNKHLQPLIGAAMNHPGTSVIDVISPCVTFNNQPDSRKSYDYIREHKSTLQELGFIDRFEEIKVDIPEGTSQDIKMPDGSFLKIKKLHPSAHDVTSRDEALQLLRTSRASNQILTGLFYINSEAPNLVDSLEMVETPLAQLSEADLRIDPPGMQKVMDEYR